MSTYAPSCVLRAGVITEPNSFVSWKYVVALQGYSMPSLEAFAARKPKILAAKLYSGENMIASYSKVPTILLYLS